MARSARALVSLGIDQDYEAALQEMVDKHPQVEVPEVAEEEPEARPLTVTNREVYEAVRGFKLGTPPGPSGLMGEHLKEAGGGTLPDW